MNGNMSKKQGKRRVAWSIYIFCIQFFDLSEAYFLPERPLFSFWHLSVDYFGLWQLGHLGLAWKWGPCHVLFASRNLRMSKCANYKVWKARSRLHRSRFCQYILHTLFAACLEIYTIYALLHRSKISNFMILSNFKSLFIYILFLFNIIIYKFQQYYLLH